MTLRDEVEQVVARDHPDPHHLLGAHASNGNVERMLAIFELEKAVYELRYELNNRPDWVGIPVAGIARLLEEPIP